MDDCQGAFKSASITLLGGNKAIVLIIKWRDVVTYMDAYIIIVVVYIFGLLCNVGLQLFFTLVLHVVLPIILGQALLYEASSELDSNCNNLLHSFELLRYLEVLVFITSNP